MLQIRGDGYVNMTELSNFVGRKIHIVPTKLTSNLHQLKTTESILARLSVRTCLPVNMLIQTGGKTSHTWVHKDMIYAFLLWCDPTIILDINDSLRHVIPFLANPTDITTPDDTKPEILNDTYDTTHFLASENSMLDRYTSIKHDLYAYKACCIFYILHIGVQHNKPIFTFGHTRNLEKRIKQQQTSYDTCTIICVFKVVSGIELEHEFRSYIAERHLNTTDTEIFFTTPTFPLLQVLNDINAFSAKHSSISHQELVIAHQESHILTLREQMAMMRDDIAFLRTKVYDYHVFLMF
jgi:hypothetical protein